MKASAGFVSASALGMACGPALAALLQTNFKIFKITFNQDTLPGWIMALAWLLYLVWLWFSFKEPYNDEKLNSNWKNSNNGMWTIFGFSVIQSYIINSKKNVIYFFLLCIVGLKNDVLENFVSQPLLTGSLEKQQENNDEGDDENDSQEEHKPVTSIVSAYKLLTPSVKVRFELVTSYFSNIIINLFLWL